MTRSELLEYILESVRLEENWNSYGGLPLAIRAAQHAYLFALAMEDSVIEKITDAGPTPNGTFMFEWEKSRSSDWVGMEIGNTNIRLCRCVIEPSRTQTSTGFTAVTDELLFHLDRELTRLFG